MKTLKQGLPVLVDGFTVTGVKGKLKLGSVGWHVKAHRGQPPICCYWVSGDRFYRVGYSTQAPFVQKDAFTEIEPNEFISGLDESDIADQCQIDPAERDAVLEAIRRWENFETQQSRTN